MAKIGTLMAGRLAGEIRITNSLVTCSKEWFFRPFYYDDRFWYGLDDRGKHTYYDVHDNDWCMYMPPKKTVKVYPAVVEKLEGDE